MFELDDFAVVGIRATGNQEFKLTYELFDDFDWGDAPSIFCLAGNSRVFDTCTIPQSKLVLGQHTVMLNLDKRFPCSDRVVRELEIRFVFRRCPGGETQSREIAIQIDSERRLAKSVTNGAVNDSYCMVLFQANPMVWVCVK